MNKTENTLQEILKKLLAIQTEIYSSKSEIKAEINKLQKQIDEHLPEILDHVRGIDARTP